MLIAGADKLCFVISPGKSDILEYYGGSVGAARICYVVQPRPAGLCDAMFAALPFIAPDEAVLIGLPDTIWFPEAGLAALGPEGLSFLLFPVDEPQYFDAVVTDGAGRVLEIQVKRPQPDTRWVWGAFKLSGWVLRDLHNLWLRRERRDEYVGTLVTAYLAEGGQALGVPAGEAYVDVGTLNGYRQAIQLLSRQPAALGPRLAPATAPAPGRVEARP
jgi:dTDP-glucose pyrophosphorylase